MKSVMIAAVVALGVAAPAFASTAKMDTNGDGKVSLQEMQQRRVMKTMKLDANGDGRLTKAEYAAVLEQRYEAKGMDQARAQAKAEKLFAKTDMNGDGFVTADEIRQATARRFARMAGGAGYVPVSAGRHQHAAGGYQPAPGGYQPAPAYAQPGAPQAPSN